MRHNIWVYVFIFYIFRVLTSCGAKNLGPTILSLEQCTVNSGQGRDDLGEAVEEMIGTWYTGPIKIAVQSCVKAAS